MQLKNYFLYVIAVSMLFSCEPTPQAKVEPDSTPKKAAYSGPPYTIKLEEFVNPAIPGLHSYIHAVYEDKLIMIGGRTNGLHMNYNFSLEHANQKIYVVDTRNWGDPSDWEVHSMAYSQVKGIDNAQFRSNNAQFFQEKGVLYIVGGLEYANVATSARHREGKVELILAPGKTLDGKPAKAPTTLPYMTAVNLDDLVLAVMSSGTLAPPNVRQVKNDSLAVTGGELEVIKGKVFLVFGWNFGANTADYTHEIRTFTYSDDGNTLGLGPITVCPTCWDGETPPSNLGNFRRRDGSMSPIIDVRDESEGLMF
ncbi:MAG TPA: hypothetical protein ENJ82_16650, partial [Bacteroidetes bacterium]|nr:hypothetical protein [Bacteroidota bacterium]